MTTKNQKHTPGPWTYEPGEYDGFDGPSVQSEFGLIVSMPKPEDAEGRANARLIAAAPDLLAALRDAEEKLAAYVEEDGLPEMCAMAESLETARAAIKKAEEKR